MILGPSSAPQRYAGAPSEIQRLRDRVAEPEELLGINPKLPHSLGCRPRTGQICELLLRREFISRYSVEVAFRNGEDMSGKFADTHLCRVRRFLKLHHIVLLCRRGVGWYIATADKPKLRTLLQGSQP